MKRFLLSFLFFATLAFINKINAQCTVSNANVTNYSRISNGDGTCTIKFDLSFTMQNNNGNKTIVIHLWPGSTYPFGSAAHNYEGSGSGSGQLTAAQLSTSYGSIVINNNATPPVYYATYPFASGVTILSASPTITRTGGATSSAPYNFSLTGITIPNVSCASSTVIRGDIWSTNSSALGSGTKPQCSTSGMYLGVGDPTITGFKTCNSPRTINFGIATTNASPLTVTYKLYKSDGDLSFDPSTDLDVTLPGSTTVTIDNTHPFSASGVGYVGNNAAGENNDIWVVVSYTVPGSSPAQITSVSRLFAIECAPLPVAFKSFTATKGSSSVALRWTTSTEVNSKGFYVQRFYNGKWENLMFVATKAEGGNSQSDLNYTYTDNSNVAGTVQYRILQLDLDNKAKFSEIRSISDALQASHLLVYPNPSTNGLVSIVLNDANATYDIQVLDAAGRIVKLYNSVRNTLQISSLPRGQYLAKVLNQQSGESKVEKFIILK